MTKITIRVLCLLTMVILALTLPSFASDDPGNIQLKSFRDRFNVMRAESDKLWIKMDSAQPEDFDTQTILMEESHALSRRFIEFGYEVLRHNLTRQQVKKRQFADLDAFLFLGAASYEMSNVLQSRTDFMNNRRAIFLTAVNKHQEIVEMFLKASHDAEVLNK